MTFAPQRFIHAANIRLDVPVSVDTGEELSDELRLLFEDATTGSFERVVLECIERDVDFLLLSGNIFIEADRSLRARLALLRGFEQLNQAEITVFVIPGDSDPPEAWRSIPDLPPNVAVAYSSNPEPLELVNEDGLVLTTVAASAWYGERDAFGIRVIAAADDEHQPFRISVISEAKFEEARRMAAVSGEVSDELLAASLQNSAIGDAAEPDVVGSHGKRVRLTDPGHDSLDSDLDETSEDLESMEGLADPDDVDEADEPGFSELEEIDASRHESIPIHIDRSENPSATDGWDDAFVAWVDETMHEGRLNYLAFTGDLIRRSLVREAGLVHCPGTTQPRNDLEAEFGTCSLVEVADTGAIRVRAIDTSIVDWKSFSIEVDQPTTLTSLMQTMKATLQNEAIHPSDRIWAVRWALRGNLALLRQLVENDLDVALAVELDELTIGGRTVRLLHEVCSLPAGWELKDPKALAQQYLNLVDDEVSIADPVRLPSILQGEGGLTPGWRQRLNSLVAGLDAERILAQLRSDGADWFIQDLSELTGPELDSDDSAGERISADAIDDEEDDDSDPDEADQDDLVAADDSDVPLGEDEDWDSDDYADE
ncbi:MAG: hypothetical protein KDA96_06255 [Planctomycetaceae bacterium]|nr:hypothetical protein [Planctomycetaceae bacterium]